jgi:hypothetical protein
MRGAAAIFLAAVVLTGCEPHSQGTSGEASAFNSVCNLPKIHSQFDGRRARVRGLFDVHSHGVFLKDLKCPGYMLTLKQADNGPNVSLCEPERLAQEFGCPGGNDNGPIVTVVGILKSSKNPEYGEIMVEEMLDFQNARTGERFSR